MKNDRGKGKAFKRTTDYTDNTDRQAYRMGMKRILISKQYRLVAWTMLALIGGCSSFNSRWKAAVDHAPGAPAPTTDQILGRWEGTWTSEANGHNGPLLCIVTKTGPQAYSAAYHATYFSVLHFDYVLPMTAEQQGEKTVFKGDADLGYLAGGVYHFDGHATASDFHCTYQSKDDHGYYALKRPPATQPATAP